VEALERAPAHPAAARRVRGSSTPRRGPRRRSGCCHLADLLRELGLAFRGRPGAVRAIRRPCRTTGRRARRGAHGRWLLVRRADFEAAGGFDESFFLYAEETDLLRRFRDAGRRILFVPDAEVVHAGGRSGGDRLSAPRLAGAMSAHHGGAQAGIAAIVSMPAWPADTRRRPTPGERGRARRLRYRSALARRSAR
jgi:hypothetical protein